MKNAAWIAAMAAGLMLAPAARATTSFQTIPIGGLITASESNELIGWGFTLINDTDYLVVTGSSFVQTGGDSIVDPTTYTDIISTGFNPIGPGNTTWTEDFDTVNNPPQTGLGSIMTDPGVIPAGALETGTITITYDLSTDPGGNDVFSSGNSVSTDVEIEFVPEPATFGLAGIALVAIGWMRRNKRKRSLTA